MKTLFKFKLNQEQEVEEIEQTTDEKGESIKILKKVKKQIPQGFAIKQPNRAMIEDAELFYGVKLADGIRAGLMTRALLEKRFLNDGGILSDTEKDSLKVLYSTLLDDKTALEKLESGPKNEETKKEKETIEKRVLETRGKLQEFEANQLSLYDHTAESKARNKTIFWWILQLSLKEKTDGSYEPIFGDGSIPDREKKYDEIEQGTDKFLIEATQKLVYLISFWYVGKAVTEEDFNEVLKSLETSDVKQ